MKKIMMVVVVLGVGLFTFVATARHPVPSQHQNEEVNTNRTAVVAVEATNKTAAISVEAPTKPPVSKSCQVAVEFRGSDLDQKFNDYLKANPDKKAKFVEAVPRDGYDSQSRIFAVFE